MTHTDGCFPAVCLFTKPPAEVVDGSDDRSNKVEFKPSCLFPLVCLPLSSAGADISQLHQQSQRRQSISATAVCCSSTSRLRQFTSRDLTQHPTLTSPIKNRAIQRVCHFDNIPMTMSCGKLQYYFSICFIFQAAKGCNIFLNVHWLHPVWEEIHDAEELNE